MSVDFDICDCMGEARLYDQASEIKSGWYLW